MFGDARILHQLSLQPWRAQHSTPHNISHLLRSLHANMRTTLVTMHLAPDHKAASYSLDMLSTVYSTQPSLLDPPSTGATSLQLQHKQRRPPRRPAEFRTAALPHSPLRLMVPQQPQL